MMGCAVLPHLLNLVNCIAHGLSDEQQKVRTMTALGLAALAEAAAPYACERVFSSGKETMTARRSRISPELMEALQLLKFSFRRGCFWILRLVRAGMMSWLRRRQPTIQTCLMIWILLLQL
jgi:hypothetical protein